MDEDENALSFHILFCSKITVKAEVGKHNEQDSKAEH